MKIVPQFPVHFSWIGVVSASESVAVVEQIAAITDVQGINGERPAFSEAFPERNAKRRVPG